MQRTVDTGTNELLCEIDSRVATVTLNKPHKKNALGDALTPALRALLLELEARRDVGCVMITGAGDAFCSGGDVSGMGGGGGSVRSFDERVLTLKHGQETLTGRLYHLAKPTVAALPGAAAGAGLSIALACDIRIAAESAFMVTAFRNIGLSGDYGASWLLPRLIGLARAKSMFFKSARVSAREAQAIGLVDEVYPVDRFREEAFGYARAIANGPTEALQRMKVNLNQGLDQALEASLALEARHMVQSMASADAQEAIRAFMEKRAPQFHPEDGS